MVGFGLSSDFGLGLQRFSKESQGCMTNLRKIGWGFEDFKGMLSRGGGFAFQCAGFGDGCVNLRID